MTAEARVNEAGGVLQDEYWSNFRVAVALVVQNDIGPQEALRTMQLIDDDSSVQHVASQMRVLMSMAIPAELGDEPLF